MRIARLVEGNVVGDVQRLGWTSVAAGRVCGRAEPVDGQCSFRAREPGRPYTGMLLILQLHTYCEVQLYHERTSFIERKKKP